MRERGLGGSKCGATAATVVLLPRQGSLCSRFVCVHATLAGS
jgi:hypothetical protein